MSDRVRPLRSDDPPPARRRFRFAGVVAAVVLLVAAFAFSSGSSPQPAPATDHPTTESVTRAFFAALGEGDAGGAAALVADDRSLLVLPGSGAVIAASDPLRERLAFLAGVQSIDLGDCGPERRAGGDVGVSSVRCAAVVSSEYREDVGLAETAGTITAVVQDGRIRAVASTVDDRFGGFVDYCVWAHDTDPIRAADLFDEACLPVENAGSVAGHLALAAAYAVRGDNGTVASPTDVVAAFASAHNAGLSPLGLFEETFRVATFPGVPIDGPRWPFPDLGDYLEWSSVVYDIDLGRCVADQRSGPGLIAVDCTAATLDGPLPTELGLTAVPTPMRFFVEDGRIVGVSGRSPQLLLEAYAARCSDLDTPAVVDERCTPGYDAEAARALLGSLMSAP